MNIRRGEYKIKIIFRWGRGVRSTNITSFKQKVSVLNKELSILSSFAFLYHVKTAFIIYNTIPDKRPCNK